MRGVGPIITAHLFPSVSKRLAELLRSLGEDDWRRPTVSSRRTVHDIAAHLLDGSLRRLSFQRDAFRDPRNAPRGDEPLPAFLHRLNAEWETAARRLSPRVLVDWMEIADRELAEFFASLDPHGEAIFPVAWAGEARSEHWFDVAREYSEKWHHTAQIFDATGRPSTIDIPELMRPVVETFLRALPYAYRNVEAAEGTRVTVVVTGPAGGRWGVERAAGAWRLFEPAAGESMPRAAAVVTLDADTAWRLFTKRHSPEDALRRFPTIRIEGDERLTGSVLGMISVMA